MNRGCSIIMNDLEITALRSNEDYTPWMVYSDYLEEHNELEKARLCRCIANKIKEEPGKKFVLVSGFSHHVTSNNWSSLLFGFENHDSFEKKTRFATDSSTKFFSTYILAWIDKTDYWYGRAYDSRVSEPNEYIGLIENIPELAWKFYKLRARQTKEISLEAKKLACLIKIPNELIKFSSINSPAVIADSLHIFP